LGRPVPRSQLTGVQHVFEACYSASPKLPESPAVPFFEQGISNTGHAEGIIDIVQWRKLSAECSLERLSQIEDQQADCLSKNAACKMDSKAFLRVSACPS